MRNHRGHFIQSTLRHVGRKLAGGLEQEPGSFVVHLQHALFGADPFPYGVEPNRTTLEAYLRYAHEQGVCHRLLKPEELFAPQTLASFKV